MIATKKAAQSGYDSEEQTINIKLATKVASRHKKAAVLIQNCHTC